MSAPATRLEHDQFFTGISLLICLVVGTPRLIAVVHLPIDR